MKKSLLLIPLALLLIFTGCKTIQQLLTFYIDDSQTVHIPASPTAITMISLPPVSVSTQSDAKFKNNNTSANLVKDITLNKLTLTITDPTAQNFNFLQKIEIDISTNANDQIRLAYLDVIPQNVSSIDLNLTDAKLDSYVKASSYTLTTKVQTNQPLAKDVTMRVDTRFKVTADPF